MLKIHKTFFQNKLFLISITSILSIGVLLGLSLLTYTPELSHAEQVVDEPFPVLHPNLDDIAYMQEMTEEVCRNTYNFTTKRLIDKRKNADGTQPKYWVTKLKDGKCWMTQNLDLDIPAEGLKAEDTDILEDWNKATNPSYPPKVTLKVIEEWHNSSFGDDPGVINSFDPGIKFCGTNQEEKCNLSVSRNNGHDISGNYYTFNAATAGKGETKRTSGENVENSSICPKGWRLPTSGMVGSNFYVLLNGLTPSQMMEGPYYMILSGNIRGKTWYIAGGGGYLWSSTVDDETWVYNPYFNSNKFKVFSKTYRDDGIPVRCVARGEAISRNKTNVDITIKPQLSLEITPEIVITKSDTNPSTGNLDAKVSSNMPYLIQINAKDNVNLTSTTSDAIIPARPGLLNTAQNGWGIKKHNDDVYTAMNIVPQTFYTAFGAEIEAVTSFTVGVSTATDLPNSEYSTDITVTAMQN